MGVVLKFREIAASARRCANCRRFFTQRLGLHCDRCLRQLPPLPLSWIQSGVSAAIHDVKSIDVVWTGKESERAARRLESVLKTLRRLHDALEIECRREVK